MAIFHPIHGLMLCSRKGSFQAVVRVGQVRSSTPRRNQNSYASQSGRSFSLWFDVPLMAPGYYEALVSLQLEFERSLLGLASWVVPEVVRAVGGWQLDWGERVMADVLAFRAELWCCSADMLVNRLWSEAQHFNGKTFATASQSLVIYFSVGEVHDHPFWGHGAEAKRKALLAYKISVKNALVARSTARWKSSLQARAGTGIHILAQQYPVSVGHILLDHDRLDLLWDAMSFDSLRLQTLRTSGEDISGQSCCLLCGGLDHGLAHLLTEVYLYTGR